MTVRIDEKTWLTITMYASVGASGREMCENEVENRGS